MRVPPFFKLYTLPIVLIMSLSGFYILAFALIFTHVLLFIRTSHITIATVFHFMLFALTNLMNLYKHHSHRLILLHLSFTIYSQLNNLL